MKKYFLGIILAMSSLSMLAQETISGVQGNYSGKLGATLSKEHIGNAIKRPAELKITDNNGVNTVDITLENFTLGIYKVKKVEIKNVLITPTLYGYSFELPAHLPLETEVLGLRDAVLTAYITIENAGTATIEYGEIEMPFFMEFNNRKLFLLFKGKASTTGIENLTVESVENPVIYDLNGRRVEKPSKGIYIVNGKKVLFK